MQKNLHNLVLIACFLGILGCATAPETHTVNNTRTYQTSYDQVWEKLVAFFASHNIQIKNIAKDSGVIYAESTTFDDSFADCGKPGLFQVIGRRANFNVFVKRDNDKETTVTVNTAFTETRQFESAIQNVQCNSRGALEAAVLTSVSQ